jgi:hypothetical protein
MKLSKMMIFILATSFIGCDNTNNFDNGPCKFAPPESKFPVFQRTCEECYFNLNFQGKKYSFAGNQIPSDAGGGYSQMNNAFLSFYLVSPNSDKELNNSVAIKTPLLKLENIKSLNNSPPLVTTAFGIYNYCNDFFEPITENINQSYHQLTKVEFLESYRTEINFEPFQLFSYYLTGELKTTFIINGETQIVTAQYRVKSIIYEKL